MNANNSKFLVFKTKQKPKQSNLSRLVTVLKGGKGSGDHGHSGRPGKRGGSSGGSGSGVGGHAATVASMADDSQYAKLFSVLDASDDANESWDDIANRMSKDSGVAVDDVKFTHASFNFVDDEFRGGVANPDYKSLRTAASEEFNLLHVASGDDVKLADVKGLKLPLTDKIYHDGHVSNSNQRKLLRQTYENTQNDLRKAGYKPTDTITVYRGMYSASGLTSGSVLDYRGQSLDSWTFEKGVAADFGTVIGMNVPIRNILDIGVNGFGAPGEAEVVILGGNPSKVLVL